MSIRHATIRTLAFVLTVFSIARPAAAQETCVAGHGHWGGGPPEAVEHWSGGGEQLLAIGKVPSSRCTTAAIRRLRSALVKS